MPAAVERTAATAGRTIAFSALTVAVCLSALFVFDDPTFRAIGAAGVAVVVVALLAALTLVPALLAVAGGRIRRRRVAPPDRGSFSRLAGAVQRRPGRWRSGWPAAARRRHPAAVAPAAEQRRPAAAAVLRERPGRSRTWPRASPAAARAGHRAGARDPRAQLDAYVAGLADRVGPDRADVAAGRPAARLGGSPYATVDITPTGHPQGDAAQAAGAGLREHRPAVPELGDRRRRGADRLLRIAGQRGCRSRSG